MMAIAQFFADTDIPVPSVTADQMQEVDCIAVIDTATLEHIDDVNQWLGN